MTWNEFVKKVERELEVREIPRDTELWYIELAFIDGDEIEVSIDKDLGIEIS